MLVHAAALGVVVSLTVAVDIERTRFAGNPLVIQASMSSAAEPEPTEETVQEGVPVVIRPTSAEIAPKRYYEATSERVLPEEMLSPDVIEEMATAEVAELPAASAPPPPPMEEQTAVVETVAIPRQTATTTPPVKPSQVRKPQTLGTDAKVRPNFAGNRPPSYPALARQRQLEGEALLRLHVAVDGQVTKVEIVRSSGHAILDAEAVTTVRSWRGEPATQNGRPVATVELLPVRFRLR